MSSDRPANVRVFGPVIYEWWDCWASLTPVLNLHLETGVITVDYVLRNGADIHLAAPLWHEYFGFDIPFTHPSTP